MSAAPKIARSNKSTVYIEAERRRTRSSDAEVALAFQLEHVRAAHAVDCVVVADLDGAAIASAGTEEESIDLAAFVAAAAKDSHRGRNITTTRGFVQVELVTVGARTFVLGASTRFGVPDPSGIARAVAGIARILLEGIPVEAPIPLVRFGGWGDWDSMDYIVDGEG
jgi:hypothetical protein